MRVTKEQIDRLSEENRAIVEKELDKITEIQNQISDLEDQRAVLYTKIVCLEDRVFDIEDRVDEILYGDSE